MVDSALKKQHRDKQRQGPGTRYLHFPAYVRPKPIHNQFYRVTIGGDGLEIGTVQGLYGHKKSKVLASIPSSRLLQSRCATSGLEKTRWCVVDFLDEPGKRQVIKIAAVGQRMWFSDVPDDSQVTEMACHFLEQVRLGKPIHIRIPYLYTIKPINPVWKLVAGAIFLIAFFVLPNLGTIGLDPTLLLFAYGCVSVALGAFLIDLLRMHTSWHPAIKLGILALASLLLCVLFGFLMTAL